MRLVVLEFIIYCLLWRNFVILKSIAAVDVKGSGGDDHFPQLPVFQDGFLIISKSFRRFWDSSSGTGFVLVAFREMATRVIPSILVLLVVFASLWNPAFTRIFYDEGMYEFPFKCKLIKSSRSTLHSCLLFAQLTFRVST